MSLAHKNVLKIMGKVTLTGGVQNAITRIKLAAKTFGGASVGIENLTTVLDDIPNMDVTEAVWNKGDVVEITPDVLDAAIFGTKFSKTQVNPSIGYALDAKDAKNIEIVRQLFHSALTKSVPEYALIDGEYKPTGNILVSDTPFYAEVKACPTAAEIHKLLKTKHKITCSDVLEGQGARWSRGENPTVVGLRKVRVPKFIAE